MDQDQAVAIWRRALDLHGKGHLSEAEELYRQLIGTPYAFGQVHYHLALILMRNGRHDDAGRSLQRALDASPLDPDMHFEMARLQEASGRLDEAASSYARTIELRVGHSEAQLGLSRLQARRGRIDESNLVSIVTASLGRPELARAIASISAQHYRNIEHLIVADGPEAEGKVREIAAAAAPSVPTHVLALPWNTGRDEFRGHRIYAAFIHLVNGRFVSFLDDDNWLDPDHVASLVSCAVLGKLEWAYALRKIVLRNGTFLANDDCQSLGAWESIEASRGTDRVHLVDTNCYFLRRDIAVAHSAIWHRRSFDARRSPDVVLCEKLLAEHRHFRTTGKYSVNYAIDDKLQAIEARFFLEGNAQMQRRHPNGFPWSGAAASPAVPPR